MRYLLIISGLLLSAISFAQSQSNLEKIEAARIALITERLELSPEQAEKFWPIYREFSEKQRSLRQEFRQLRANHDPQSATEEQNRQILERGMQLKERQLNMEKTYAARLQQVISTQQLMSLRKAEDDFREMLMKRIRERHQQREQIQNDRLRNNENMQRKRNN